MFPILRSFKAHLVGFFCSAFWNITDSIWIVVGNEKCKSLAFFFADFLEFHLKSMLQFDRTRCN